MKDGSTLSDSVSMFGIYMLTWFLILWFPFGTFFQGFFKLAFCVGSPRMLFIIVLVFDLLIVLVDALGVGCPPPF